MGLPKTGRPLFRVCNLVTDYLTFIEDFQRIILFIDYLNVSKI